MGISYNPKKIANSKPNPIANDKDKSTEVQEKEEDSHELLLDRYYKSLYELILQKDVLNSRNLKEYLKLVISSCMFDQNTHRCLAILKRLIQTSTLAEPSYICCVLIIVSHVIQNKNQLWKYVDQLKLKTEVSEKKSTLSTVFYDNLNKRDPKYTNDNSLVELTILLNHYHPTVQKWTKQIIESYKSDPIDYEGDPLLDFSLANFLNKFITKNPKVKSSKDKKKEEEKKEETTGENLTFIEKFSKVKHLADEKMKKKKKQNMDIEDFADKIMEDEISKVNVGGKEEDSIEDDLQSENDDQDIDEDEEFEDEEEEIEEEIDD